MKCGSAAWRSSACRRCRALPGVASLRWGRAAINRSTSGGMARISHGASGLHARTGGNIGRRAALCICTAFGRGVAGFRQPGIRCYRPDRCAPRALHLACASYASSKPQLHSTPRLLAPAPRHYSHYLHPSHPQAERGVADDTALTAADLKTLVGRYKQVYRSLGKVSIRGWSGRHVSVSLLLGTVQAGVPLAGQDW